VDTLVKLILLLLELVLVEAGAEEVGINNELLTWETLAEQVPKVALQPVEQ
jgi:hypothetical protein